MTKQLAWLAAVRSRASKVTELTIVTEWLGYLPFGLYIWVELGTEHVPDAELPSPWDSSDIAALVAGGFLEEIARVVLSDDGYDTRTTYRITPAGEAALTG